MPPKIGEPEDTPPVYVYNLTLKEARDHFAQTSVFKECFDVTGEVFEPQHQGFQLPTLDEVFEALDR